MSKTLIKLAILGLTTGVVLSGCSKEIADEPKPEMKTNGNGNHDSCGGKGGCSGTGHSKNETIKVEPAASAPTPIKETPRKSAARKIIDGY